MLITTSKNRDILEHHLHINKMIKEFFDNDHSINYTYSKEDSFIRIVLTLKSATQCYVSTSKIPLESKMLDSKANKFSIKKQVNIMVANIFHKFSAKSSRGNLEI